MPGSLAEALSAYRGQLRPPAGGPRPRRWRPWLVGALTASVLLGGLAAVLLRDPAGTADQAAAEDQAPAPDAASSIDPDAADTPSTAPAAAAADPGASAAELLTAPSASWRTWSSPLIRTWLPAIPGAGPADQARLAGFARTPGGALAAAVSLHPVIYHERDRAEWTRLADQQVVWADGQREQLATALDAVWDTAPETAWDLVPVGYRVISYSPDRARFRIWWQWLWPDSTPVAGALVEVVWAGGDWRLYFDEPAMDMRLIEPARDSYIAWSPR